MRASVAEQAVEAGVVDGRTLTSWPSLRTDLANAGAITGNGVAAAATAANTNYLISGSYNATTGVFTVNTASGADTLVVTVGTAADAFGIAAQTSNVLLIGVSSVSSAAISALNSAII